MSRFYQQVNDVFQVNLKMRCYVQILTLKAMIQLTHNRALKSEISRSLSLSTCQLLTNWSRLTMGLCCLNRESSTTAYASSVLDCDCSPRTTLNALVTHRHESLTST